jgi:uncharacterized protein YijF (DUF1287 family)
MPSKKERIFAPTGDHCGMFESEESMTRIGMNSSRAAGAVALVAGLLLMAAPAFADDLPAPLRKILQSAYDQVGITLLYDPSYQTIRFPGGDVPIDRGVCTDVIVRAYRGVGIDLQRLVNQDMRQSFSSYPRLWGLSRPDPNIDHRRVQNLAVFFTRHGQVLPISAEAHDYAPGDIVSWRLPGGQPHIGLVSDRDRDGRPLIVHNIGGGAKLEDILFAYQITGHYRFLPDRT